MSNEKYENIELTTISPVHIGTGETLKKGVDFLDFNIKLYVLDENAIGKKILESNIDNGLEKYTRAIGNQNNIKTLIEECNVDSITDVSIRVVKKKNDCGDVSTFKTHIYTSGRLYIPGSSIKGAFRTAVLAMNMKDTPLKEENYKKKEREIEGKIKDSMRLLQIGDFMTDESIKPVAIKTSILNQKESKTICIGEKPAILECILDNQSMKSRIIINHNLRNRAFPELFFVEGFGSLVDLFSLTNSHTKKILEDEMEFWCDFINDEKILGYISHLECVKKMVDSCLKEECVIRIGYGNGWLTKTGNWAEDEVRKCVRKLVHRKNENKYANYPFPKSRRIIHGSLKPLGFIKLRIL